MYGCPSCEVGNCTPCPMCGDYDPLYAEHGPRYFDRVGNPIPMGRWGELAQDFNYKCLRKTTVGQVEVSTVWLGLDHRMLWGPPLIFETMLFEVEPSVSEPSEFFPQSFEYYETVAIDGEDQWRYTTETEALKGHERVVARLRLSHDALMAEIGRMQLVRLGDG